MSEEKILWFKDSDESPLWTVAELALEREETGAVNTYHVINEALLDPECESIVVLEKSSEIETAVVCLDSNGFPVKTYYL